jgi:hypothetical protein
MAEKTLDLSRRSDAAINHVLPRNPAADPALRSWWGAYGLVGAQDGEAGMSRSIRKTESDLSDTTRFQLLVEAVTDYAIYMLDPTALS